VTQVYGPRRPAAPDRERSTTTAIVSLYGAPELRRDFGVDDAELIERGEFAIARFPLRRFRASMRWARRCGVAGAPGRAAPRRPRPDSGAPQPFHGTVDALRAPLAIHVTDGRNAALGGWARLYWIDERHVHWRAVPERGRAPEFVILDDARYATDWMALWRRVPAVDGAPLEWGRFVLALPSRAMERAAENQAWTFQWQGYDVVAFPAGPHAGFPSGARAGGGRLDGPSRPAGSEHRWASRSGRRARPRRALDGRSCSTSSRCRSRYPTTSPPTGRSSTTIIQ
jgi:hypothetical protein